MSLRGGVRCIFVYVYFPHLLGGFLHIITCTCNYMLWPLAPREYNLSIPNKEDHICPEDEEEGRTVDEAP
jgi:hypothetical protein